MTDDQRPWRLPILGFPSSTAQSSVTISSTEVRRWGILGDPRWLAEPQTDYYRADIRTESGLREYLNQRRVHLLDPYPGLYFDSVH